MGKPIVPLQVIARSPFLVYYEGRAMALSATNRIGKFDILPGHADFFSVLQPGQVIIDILDPAPDNTPEGQQPEEAEEKEKPADYKAGDQPQPIIFNIVNGIVTVRDDKVMLFVNM